VAFLWDGVELATAGVVAADGTAAAQFFVPEEAPVGLHTVTSQCVGTGEQPHSESFDVIEPTTTQVVVPRVVGSTLAQATEKLVEAGLVVGVRTGEGSLVVEQQPDAGLEVDPDTPVDLHFDSDEATVELVPVPELVGEEVVEAQVALLASELELGLVTGRGEVVRIQNPAAGTLAPAGSSVNISTRRSIVPAELVTVPDLVGLTVADARRVCEAVGLVLGDTPGTQGEIASQQPIAGTLIPVDSPVTVALLEPSDWTRTLGTLSALVLLVAGAAAATVASRRHRERLWVGSHVELAPVPGKTVVAEPVETDDSDQTARHVVQLTPRADPGSTVVVEEWTDEH
jgi:hypothetical protein